jgi:hypothetical protein
VSVFPGKRYKGNGKSISIKIDRTRHFVRQRGPFDGGKGPFMTKIGMAAWLILPFLSVGCVGTDVVHEKTITDGGASEIAPTPTPGPGEPTPIPTPGPSVCASLRVTAWGVSSARVWINDEPLLTAGEFNGEPLLEFERPLLLFEGENRLKLRLRGAPEEILKVQLFNCAFPPNPLFEKTYQRTLGEPKEIFTDTFDSTYNPD